jgi:hypothetical protein
VTYALMQGSLSTHKVERECITAQTESARFFCRVRLSAGRVVGNSYLGIPVC